MRVKTLAPIRRTMQQVIGLPLHRAQRPVDADSLAVGWEPKVIGDTSLGKHRRGLAEVFRRRFAAAMDERRATD